MQTDGNWRSDGHHVGTLVVLRAGDNGRVGRVWMAGRILDGDVAMAVRHAGDCFWSYQLLQHGFYQGMSTIRSCRLIAPSEFGAYTCGRVTRWQPNDLEVHLLFAGESVEVSFNYDEAFKAL